MTLAPPGVPNPSKSELGPAKLPLPSQTLFAGRGHRSNWWGCTRPMASRSRIRWENVAKLGAGGIACLALVAGLPALVRRPAPPPLEADIGFAPTRMRQAQPTDGLRVRGGDRRRRSGSGHRVRDRAGRRPHARPNRHPPRSPERARRSAPQPPAPAPAPGGAPPPSPPAPVAPPRPPAPPPAPAPPHPDPPPPSPPSEFGFER
jgi:hypothetical protein